MNLLTPLRPWISRTLSTTMLSLAFAGMPALSLMAQDSDGAVDRAPVLSFAPVVKRDAPSVVTIFTSRTVKNQMQQMQMAPGMEEQLKRFFDMNGQGDVTGPLGRHQQMPDMHEKALGSGVIVSPDGYILTNNHVIDQADDIHVSLSKGHESFVAKVVGADAKSDLAVLKIEAGRTLPAITFGDSAKAEVGDVVLAMGNPFGVGQSVTMGIISGRSRDLGMAEYEDFLQTDASINPGNSGGALVDATGKLIGINTAILSPSGGNLGIGFAVPINQARVVMDSIITKHHVVRSYLGIYIQELTPELADSFNIPKNTTGVLVSGLMPEGPAAKSGIKGGDVVLTLNSVPVEDTRTLRMLTSQSAPGSMAALNLLRDGKPITIMVQLAEMGAESTEGHPHQFQPAHENHGKLGLQLSNLDEDTRTQLHVPAEIEGAVVTEVAPGSAAEKAGIAKGDIIVELNHQPVTSISDVADAVAKAHGKMLVCLWTAHGTRYVLAGDAN